MSLGFYIRVTREASADRSQRETAVATLVYRVSEWSCEARSAKMRTMYKVHSRSFNNQFVRRCCPDVGGRGCLYVCHSHTHTRNQGYHHREEKPGRLPVTSHERPKGNPKYAVCSSYTLRLHERWHLLLSGGEAGGGVEILAHFPASGLLQASPSPAILGQA